MLTAWDKRRVSELEEKAQRYRQLAETTDSERMRKHYLRSALTMDGLARNARRNPFGVWLLCAKWTCVGLAVLLPVLIGARFRDPHVQALGLFVSTAFAVAAAVLMRQRVRAWKHRHDAQPPVSDPRT